MLASLLAGGVWLQIASYYGWPVSTTHAIVGALIGFGAIVGGLDAIYWTNVAFIVSSWVLSPFMGGIISYLIFSALRKRIFYTDDPLASTQKIIPLLAFGLALILTLILSYDGLEKIYAEFALPIALILSLLIGALSYIVSYFLVNRVKRLPQVVRSVPNYCPELGVALDKAKKHLLSAQGLTEGELQYEVTLALEEVQSLSESLKHRDSLATNSSEFVQVEKIFGYLQVVSACLMAFAHGANDVANAIGPLAAAINVLKTGVVSTQAYIPTWTLALGGIGIVVGLATWGWRVIETIGKKITELTPTRGFAAEFGAAITIVLASRLGMPISSTHTLVGSVIGVGLARGIEALDLRTTRDIVISWFMTVPAGAAIAVAFYYLLSFVFP